MEKIIIDTLEVWPRDLGTFNWREATAKLAELGPGWRLPTREEFKLTLNPNKAEIPGLDGSWYLSSTPGDTNTHWVFAFSDGYENYFHDDHQFWIRPVKDFTGDVALEYLLKEF